MGVTPQDFLAVNPSQAPGSPAARSEARMDRHAASSDRAASVAVAAQLISVLHDCLGLVCLAVLIGIRVVPPDPFAWGLIGLPGVSLATKALNRVRKDAPVGPTALVLAGGPFVWKAVAAVLGRSVIGAVLLLTVLTGCGQQPTLEDARVALERVERLDRSVRALCLPLPDEGLPERPACVELIDAFNALHAAPGVP